MTEQDARPSPDELLARVKATESEAKRGKLKIFLGYAAGVGKTYTMLDAARQLRRETDVVVGVVETHGRAETEALLQGMEIIPRRTMQYRGAVLTEMDIDAVLKRRPRLVLVDELAHTNAPDSRHPKRYQDVDEILDAGIDVYSTLNIQHVESLRNVVAQVTGVWIRETVPDSVIDTASEVELVDLPPDELLKRMQEGKVYVPEQIGRAINDFFRKGNLTALRELMMRTAAERVEEQVRAYMGTHSIRGPWPTAERILVCIGPEPTGASVIRAARRLAAQLGAEWHAINVEKPGDVRLSAVEQERIAGKLRLARRLGAKTTAVHGDSIATAIVDYAAKNNITKIVVGKARRRLPILLRPSVADQIMRLSDNFDVHIVSGKPEPEKELQPAKEPRQPQFTRYLAALGITGMATLLDLMLRNFVEPTVLVTSYLLVVVVSAVYLGLWPSVMASVVGMAAFDFFFIPPYYTFAVADIQFTFTLIALLAVGIVISYFTSRLRRQTELARRHERQSTILYALGRELAQLNDLEAYIHAVMNSARETFGHDAAIFLPDASSGGELHPHAHGTDMHIDENERAAAIWAYQHVQQVGFGTDTLPEAKARYVPLTTARGTVGVLALWAAHAKVPLTFEQEQILGAYADLAAVAIEGILLTEEAHKAQILMATEKLQTALLNSISHDLRTPLVSVIGALSSLKEEGLMLDEDARRNLVEVALWEGERLNHLLSNLLDMSRIEAGALKLSLQPADLGDLVSVALEQIGKRHGVHPVSVRIPDNLPDVMVDSGLIVQAFINVLDNAFKYSPDGAPVEISARATNDKVEVEVADRGIGIPSQDLERVFDKFFRLQRPDSVAGTGLGLSIVKGIVEAHGGRAMATNRPGGGTIISLSLPAAAVRAAKETAV